ncbi:unnamed protein product [Sphenostylis stenocarpa]|uniref:Uncharacterized protein n=1 Tax=Sphenostylis stenocarpa TaxID=92480 RepID=A0AA86VAQ7_9FABA|nr:unnamed protein product [Sphenostylis stenocarpa]
MGTYHIRLSNRLSGFSPTTLILFMPAGNVRAGKKITAGIKLGDPNNFDDP